MGHTEVQEGLVEPHEVPEHVEETRAGNLPSTVEVRETKGLEELAVGFELEAHRAGRAPAHELDVLRVVLAYRYRGVE